MIIQYELEQVDRAQLGVLLRALVALNILYLRAHPRTPLLKRSGVRYESQSASHERFKTIPQVIAANGGDCDQLVPWRVAELRMQGIRANPEVRKMGRNLWHVYVRMPNGRVEDISAHLGMPIPASLAKLGRAIIRDRKLNHDSSTIAARYSTAGVSWAR